MPISFRFYLPGHLGERLVEDGHELIDLLLHDDKRRSQKDVISPDPIGTAPTRVDDQPLLKSPARDRGIQSELGIKRLLGLPVPYKFDPGEKSLSPDIPHKFVPVERLQGPQEIGSCLGGLGD